MAGLASSGGLGDVSASLPRALAALGHRVSVFLPLHPGARERLASLGFVKEIPVPGFDVPARLHRGAAGEGGPELLLVEGGHFFERPGLYGDGFGDYPDNLERFAFFSRAVLEAVGALDLPVDVLHANDWHTGLLGAYRRSLYGDDPRLGRVPLVFTVHNLAYQGRFPGERFARTGLPAEVFSIDGLEFYGDLSCLKAGIVYADAVTTVSAGYAREILTPEYGEGLDGVLRARAGVLHGIRNGIDEARWNPAIDPCLAVRYDATSLDDKARCRAALLDELGLRLPREVPVLGMITRLVWQKGADLVLDSGRELLTVGSPPGPGTALVLLGSGEGWLEAGFRELAARHPQRVAVRIGFDEDLAHRIEAGADLFLMPSRYEPCGLNQMYSLRYGTLPVVRACGGLDDTVTDVRDDPERGNGFKFGPATPEALLGTVARAVAFFRNPAEWRGVQRRGMQEDFSWRRPALRYEALYRSLAAS